MNTGHVPMRFKVRALLSGCLKNGYKPRFWRFVAGGVYHKVLQWEDERWGEIIAAGSAAVDVSLEEIAPDLNLLLQFPIKRGDWDTPYSDLVALATLLKHYPSKTLFEFGTYTGLGTVTLLANSPPDAHIWSLDADFYDEIGRARIVVGEAYQNTFLAPRVTQIIQNSLELDTAPYCKKMDFIFIDAGHSYECAISDSRKALEMLAPGGVITWHDYPFHSGVRKAVDELAKTHHVQHVKDTNIAFHKDTTKKISP